MKQKIWIMILAALTVALIAVAVTLWIGVAQGGRPAIFPEAETTRTEPATEATQPAPTEGTIPAPTEGTTPAPTEPFQPVPLAQPLAAPNITVYTAQQEPVSLGELQGKPVVLNFWATWCGPCKAEMPAFEALYRQHGEDIRFMMVNLTDGYMDTLEKASAFIESAGYTFPVYYDLALEGYMHYPLDAIPATFFIDAQGQLIAYHVGAMDENMLSAYLHLLTKSED